MFVLATNIFDHSKSVRDAAKAGIDVYLSVDTMDYMKLSGHRYHPLSVFDTFQIGTFTIKTFPLVHDVHNIGFLFSSKGKAAMYATDTAYIQNRFNGLSVIAIECNHQRNIVKENIKNKSLPKSMFKRLINNHFELDNVVKFLKANDLSKVESIHLLHLSDGNSNQEEMKKAVMEATGVPVYVS